ncbi:hypothetical protein TraAM80_09773 [Trypanosoma rangeli]|uniref:Uncharacterized protein n=1 Tax=Trypanosoma rangeli TaxID=5698 RepID=A0A3R7LGQ2_TRYRA|nr:uncharacterized protein TraAM80_09773 [Trypanosoma rangeli]RNE96958.1 hypothetical protein TraAM80_09773 [Trypanosoma rangeli]|eukprot:RNE96958.1 hypothetical protein TraAM80_09773 [Trypanosoma rangeli]
MRSRLGAVLAVCLGTRTPQRSTAAEEMKTKTTSPLGTFLQSARRGKQNRLPADRLTNLHKRFVTAIQWVPPAAVASESIRAPGEGGFKFAWRRNAASISRAKATKPIGHNGPARSSVGAVGELPPRPATPRRASAWAASPWRRPPQGDCPARASACFPYRMRGEPLRHPQAPTHIAHFASVVWRCPPQGQRNRDAKQHSQSEQHGPVPGAKLFGAALTGVGFKLANDPMQATRLSGRTSGASKHTARPFLMGYVLSVLLRGGDVIAPCTVSARLRGPEASHCDSSEAFRGLSVSTGGRRPSVWKPTFPPPRKML